MSKSCFNCTHAYQLECIGVVMCPLWEMADGDNAAETCAKYVEVKTPCDQLGSDGKHHCPYEDCYTGYESEMCRNCCGVGCDEDSYPEEEYEEEVLPFS